MGQTSIFISEIPYIFEEEIKENFAEVADHKKSDIMFFDAGFFPSGWELATKHDLTSYLSVREWPCSVIVVSGCVVKKFKEYTQNLKRMGFDREFKSVLLGPIEKDLAKVGMEEIAYSAAYKVWGTDMFDEVFKLCKPHLDKNDISQLLVKSNKPERRDFIEDYEELERVIGRF